MAGFAPSRVVRGAGAAVLLAAAVLLLPQRAAAACGDYVTIADDHGAATSSPAHDTHPADGRPASPGPCHGPNCSRGPSEPFAPPAPSSTTPVQPKRWLTGLADGPEAPGRSGWCGALHSSGRAVRRPTPVFHPPRAA